MLCSTDTVHELSNLHHISSSYIFFYAMNDTAKSLMKMYLIVYLNHKQNILNYICISILNLTSVYEKLPLDILMLWVFIMSFRSLTYKNQNKAAFVVTMQPFFQLNLVQPVITVHHCESFLCTLRLHFLAVAWIALTVRSRSRCCAVGSGRSGWVCLGGSGWMWDVYLTLWSPLQPCVTCTPWEHSSSSHGTRPQSWNPENGKKMCKV